MGIKTEKFIYWAPRVLTIMFLLFLAMFSLDVFEPGLGWQQIAVGLFMHNIPVFILAAILWLSWKREIIAGIVFILAGILYMALILAKTPAGRFEWYMLSYSLIIAGPAFLIGILFLINWRHRQTHHKPALLK
jgi:hypothetical protein